MTAADRPSVTDNARAEASNVSHIGRSFHDTRLEDDCPCPKGPCGLAIHDGTDHGCDQHDLGAARTIRQMHSAADCPAAGRAETTTDNLGDAYTLGYAAAKNAETTTDTTEDAVDELRAWAVIGDGVTPADDDEEWIDRTILSSSIIDGRTERIEGRPETIVQRLADAGLLATARTHPTREHLIHVLREHDPDNYGGQDAAVWYYEAQADAVLALLADQPGPADIAAKAVEDAANDAVDERTHHWLRERAARIRGGERP